MKKQNKKNKIINAYPNFVTHLRSGEYIIFSKSSNHLSKQDKYILTVYSDSITYKKHKPKEILYMNIEQINNYLQQEMLINNFSF